MRLLITFFALLLSVTLYGQNDYSLNFDNNNVELPSDMLQNFNEFTFSAFFYADNIQDSHSNIVQFDPPIGHGFIIRYVNDLSGFEYNFDLGSVSWVTSISPIPSTNLWHHVAMTFDGDTVRAYLDGVEVGSGYASGSFSIWQGPPIYIGNWQMQEGFNGNIDDVHIWNSALSHSQIQHYMTCPLSGDEEGLVGYWNFEEGEGDTVYDLSDNGNDGTINGATWSTDVPELNCVGCIDPVACNYNPYAIEDDGSCDYTCCPGPGCCNIGMIWNWELGICETSIPTDSNLDGCTDLNDLMDLLGAYGDCAVPEFTCGDEIEHEGYSYSTVQIGNQCWFSENCRYLPEVSPSSEGSDTAPYYYVYGYEGSTVGEAQATANYETYGVLYNWPAVMTDEICPSDWHVPSDGEWQTMEISLGMSVADAASSGWRGSPVGDYMKSTSGWDGGGNGSNSSGFNGSPGGFRYSGGFHYYGNHGYWWSASESGSFSWERSLSVDYVGVARGDHSRYYGFSARCVRD